MDEYKAWENAWKKEQHLRKELESLKDSKADSKTIGIGFDTDINPGEIRTIPGTGRTRYFLVLEAEDEGRYLCVPFSTVKEALPGIEDETDFEDPDLKAIQSWYPLRIPKMKLVKSFKCDTKATAYQIADIRAKIAEKSGLNAREFANSFKSSAATRYATKEVYELKKFKF